MLKEDWNAYLTLGQDQTLCVGDTFYLQLDLNADSILWSNGDVGTESAIYSNSDIWAGIYKDSCLLYTDTLNIRFVNCTNCTVHLPNAFSPNGDDLNDTFRPVPAEGCIYNFYRLRIYSFWGEKLLDSDEGFWDGIYLGEVVENGPYVVLLEFSNDITEVPYIVKTVVYVVR
jgi:gliding motility-associated-like protein